MDSGYRVAISYKSVYPNRVVYSVFRDEKHFIEYMEEFFEITGDFDADLWKRDKCFFDKICKQNYRLITEIVVFDHRESEDPKPKRFPLPL